MKLFCPCGGACLCCSADALSVTCGSEIEAKQYEYDLERTLSHKKHERYRRADEQVSHSDHEAAMASPRIAAFMEADMRKRFFISLGVALPMMLLAHCPQYLCGTVSHLLMNIILAVLATPLVFGTGFIFIQGAYHSLKKWRLNMSVLIAVGILTAYLASLIIMFVGGTNTYFEASGMLVTFALFGHWMEMRARRGTSDALRALFDLVPPKTIVMRQEEQVSILVSDLQIGDIVLLRPGDKVPADGTVTSGQTTIDESLVTGESAPVRKHVGDLVIGGSINQSGSIQFKVTSIGADTTLGQVIQLVEKAQSSKAPGQRIADRAAAYLVVIAVAAGIVTFVGWYWGAGASLLTALSFAISAIVVACPDALGLATPTAVAVGTGIGARNNILIKSAATLEEASKIQVIALDKTGTLTEGKMKVYDIIAVPSGSLDIVLYFGASAQKFSNHPFGKAILDKALDQKVELSTDVQNFQAISGLGVKACIDEKDIVLGAPAFLIEYGIDLRALKPMVDQALKQGASVSIIAVDGQALGAFFARDTVRDTARSTIEKFKQMGIEPVMLTGDAQAVAERVAQELGIDRFFAQVLPADKSNYVKKLQKEGKFVAMVGDGINDAPALAQADVGIAIGAGTDVAMESAAIILMKSDPADILKAIALSKATVKKIQQNLFWAASYNVLAIPVASGILYPSFGWFLSPEISALLMSASSVVVVLNALLLKRVVLT